MSMNLIQLTPWGDAQLTQTRSESFDFRGTTYSYTVHELGPAVLAAALADRLSETEVDVTIAADPSPSDATSPTLTNLSASNPFSTALSATVDTDEAEGVAYWIASTVQQTPDPAQIKAGQNASGNAAAASNAQLVGVTGRQSFYVDDGALASDTYYVHVMHEDEAGNRSSVLTSSGVTI